MHYVCSDIHGRYCDWNRMLSMIRFSAEDSMYVLGDIIDRGPEPVRLMLDIFKRPNVTLLVGNHEHMMIQAMKYRNRDEFSTWMGNGGEVTLDQFRELNGCLQGSIMTALENSPVAIPDLKVKDRSFYLAHACHSEFVIHEPLLYKDTDPYDLEEIVWSRLYKDPDPVFMMEEYKELFRNYQKTTLIIGHTPTYHCTYGRMNSRGDGRISRTCKGHLINLDCGCARGKHLGCLRLEDMKEYYIA